MAKLDPDNYKSAKDVLDEHQAAQRKRKREENNDGNKDNVDDEVAAPAKTSAETHSGSQRTKKQKREGKADDRRMKQLAKTETKATQGEEKNGKGKKQRAAEKRRRRKEEIKAMQGNNSIADSEARTSSPIRVFGQDRTELGISSLQTSRKAGPENKKTQGNEGTYSSESSSSSTTSSLSPSHSSGFGTSPNHSRSSSITSIPQSASPERSILPPKRGEVEEPKISIQTEVKSNTEEARLRLSARIEALRAARKADGPDGIPARSRQELLDARRQKEEARRMDKKEQRRRMKEEETQVRAETLAKGSPLLSPSSPASATSPNLAFGRVDFGDGQRVSSGMSKISQAHRSGKGPSDPTTALIAAQKKQSRLAGLDPEKREDISEKDRWLNARKRAQGERIRDDTSLLKKTLKRKQSQKKKSEKDWRERLESVKRRAEKKQKKREGNLAKRKEEKGGKGEKGKKARPGFEGSFRAKAPSEGKRRR